MDGCVEWLKEYKVGDEQKEYNKDQENKLSHSNEAQTLQRRQVSKAGRNGAVNVVVAHIPHSEFTQTINLRKKVIMVTVDKVFHTPVNERPSTPIEQYATKTPPTFPNRLLTVSWSN